MTPFFRSRIVLSLAVAFLFSLQNLSAQAISFQLPDDFSACGAAPFEVTISNNTGDPLTEVEVTYTFTTSSGADCGVAYLAGTVSGADEVDISDPGSPVFSVADLAVGESVTFSFEAEALCPVIGCIDGAEIFVNQISVDWNGGSTSVNTPPYDIERALLVITDVEEPLLNGSLGDVLIRKITIVNSRPGALQSFLFTDGHQGGIDIASDLGTVVTSTATTWQISLTGEDFATIGDGDELFEQNETICITEEITITDCGVEIPSTVSTFTVGWGCGGEICQELSANGIVTIEESDKEPSLVFEPITSVSKCFCGPNGYEQGLRISNFGDGAALDLTVDIFQFFPINFFLIDSTTIRVDSAGVALPNVPVVSNVVPPPSFCDAPGELTDRFTYTFSDLGPGETVTIFFDVYFCDMECPRPAVNWWYDYSYFKPCPPNPFVQLNPPIEVVENGNNMLVELGDPADPPLEDDSIFTVHYDLMYDSLSLLDDTLVLEVVLPCGMAWQGYNEMILDGQMPLNLDVSFGDTFTVVTAEYLLPLSSNQVATEFDFLFDCEELCLGEQVCEDSLETTCELVEFCTSELPKIIVIPVTTTIRKCPEYPLSCNMQNCASLVLGHDCMADSLCIERPPAYVSYGFGAQRQNYGLADDNDDRLPDGTGGANLTLVERHRVIAGDTIRAEVRGEVVVDVPGSTLPFGSLEFSFGAFNMSSANSTALLTDGSGMQEIGTLIRIFDNSSGTYFDCPNSVPIVDDEGLTYLYDLSSDALGSCVPAGFEFAEGDSIIGIADFRIEHNLTPDADAAPLLGNLAVGPRILVFDQDTSMYEPLACGCERQVFEISGYRYSILPGQYALPGCDLSDYVGGSVFSLTLHEGNFFPFEYRNLLTAVDWQMNIPAGVPVSLEEARMTFLNYQGGVQILNNVPLTWTGNNPYIFDFAQFQEPPLDEGFSALFQYVFDADCTIFGSNPIEFTATLDFNDGLPEDEDPLELSLAANSLRGMVPNLSANAVLCDLISFNNQLVFDFSFANFPTLVAAQSSGAAPNTWMYVSSPSGLVTDFMLVDPATGMEFPQINGVFQLGDFPIDTVELRLIGLNTSCQTEPLELHYGWDCDPFTSQVQTPCYEQVKPLSIFSPPGEIDFTVTSPTGCFDLCDTVDYHILDIFNAQLGAVYDLTASGIIPAGLVVVPGSSEVEYPTGSGQLFPIGDPTVLPSGIVEWPLAELFDSLAMGLPGIGSAPQNAISLRFLTSTSCDFTANTFSIFAITAEQACGTPTNTVAKATDPVCINGVTVPYTTNITFETNPGFGCTDIVEHEITVTATEDIPPGACISVTLPTGILFESGTCIEFCQTNMACVPEFNGNTTTWDIPAGIEAGQLICFGFVSSGWDEIGCETGQILVRSANETQALCAATGDSCSTKVQTGALIEVFNIEQPEFELDNFEISASQNGANDVIDFAIDVTNQSTVPNEPPIVIDFFIDTDGNGSGDDLVHTENVVATLASGQSETVTGSFVISGGNLCNLVAYVSPEDQCACALDSAFVTVPITYQTEQSPTVCSNDEVQIGVTAMPGFTYQWEPADCLGDEFSATTIFNCVNDEAFPVTYDFTLSETDGGTCEINNLISVTVQPVPGIAVADSPICEGQPANIVATPGADYQWSGPGVVQGVQIQTVGPTATTIYSVTVTDDFGCSGAESVEIIVNPTPLADAGPDINVCPGQTAQLNAANQPGFDYLWSPAIVMGSPALSDPSIPDPVVLTNENTTFTLQVTDGNGCTAMDVVTVDFNGNINLEVPADLTICEGSSATLTATGADNYEWTPSGDCQDPPACSQIIVSPTVTTTYTVEASTVDGCSDSQSVTVNVDDAEIVVPLPSVQICEGESAVIFGQTVNVPGTYFDTVIVAGPDCDTIFSQDLFFYPPVDTTVFIGTVCEGAPFVFEGLEITEDTCLVFPTSTGGCDSVVCLELFFFPPIDTTLFTDTLCQGEVVVFQGFEAFSDTCVVLTSEINGCDSLVCLDLTIIDTSAFNLVADPETVEPNGEVMLSIENLSPSVFDSIFWSGGNTNCMDSLECTDVVGEESVIYEVTVFNDGCTGTDSLLVPVVIKCDPSAAEVPNVFTPNSDGTNDVFSIVAPDSEIVLNMEIWNRWGQLVYEGSEPWDGMQDGEAALSDVYIYLIEVGCPAQVEDAEEVVLKGDVTLLR